MTLISLSLSSTFPGSWTPRANRYGTVATLSPADDFGNATGTPLSTTVSMVGGADVDVGGSVEFDTVRQVLLTDISFPQAHLHDDSGLLTILSYVNGYAYETGDGPATRQTITANGPWNRIKNIAISEVSTQGLTVSNFVDVTIQTGDAAAHSLVIDNAKRGSVLASGSTDLAIHYLSNEYTWSNKFDVTLGNGNNVVSIDPTTTPEAELVSTLEPTVFNAAPQDTHLDLVVGDGQNNIDSREASSTIHLGNGNDTVALTDGHNEIWMGDGYDTIELKSNPRGPSVGPIATDVGSDVVHIGKGQGQIVISDQPTNTIAETTILLPKVPGATLAASAVSLRYGHDAPYPSRAFIDGDWSHVTIELQDFAPGSSIALLPESGTTELVVTDRVDHATREIWLQGATPSLARPHIVFGHN